MRKIKKVWLGILSVLAVLSTYIGLNQFTDRNGDSFTPTPRKPPTKTRTGGSRNTGYGLGLPPNSGTGAGTGTKQTPENKVQ